MKRRINHPKKRAPYLIHETPPSQLVLDNLLANMPGHVYWKNESGVYLGCNDRQAQSLGFKRGSDIIGKTDFELPWESSLAKRFWENDREVLETGQAKTVEESAIVNGSPAVVLSLKAPLKESNGKVIGVLGISVDITQQKRAEAKLIQAKEAAEVANHVKTEFLENMRHDLRTPLVGITGCASAIKAGLKGLENTADIEDYADHLMIASHALLNILNEVLASIKVANGMTPLLKKRFNLKETLLTIMALNQARAKEKNLALLFEHDITLPPYLIGDPLRIQRLVLELITNALNFTQQGYVKLTTQLVKHINHTVIIKIIVEDTGIGIAPDKQQLVFTQFKRLTPSYEGLYLGTGLGLSIIKQYMDDFDGEIYLDSQPGVGSTFTCVLPLKEALLDELQAVDEVSSTQEIPPRDVTQLEQTITILLVEDEAITAKVETSLLAQLGCSVTVAQSGNQALLQARSQSYDLIFMDMGLPDISGMEVTHQIRQEEKNTRTPIIALTAHIDTEHEAHCLNAAIDAILPKPLSKDIALDILNKFVLNVK